LSGRKGGWSEGTQSERPAPGTRQGMARHSARLLQTTPFLPQHTHTHTGGRQYFCSQHGAPAHPAPGQWPHTVRFQQIARLQGKKGGRLCPPALPHPPELGFGRPAFLPTPLQPGHWGLAQSRPSPSDLSLVSRLPTLPHFVRLGLGAAGRPTPPRLQPAAAPAPEVAPNLWAVGTPPASRFLALMRG
jgi:hypothetical protein